MTFLGETPKQNARCLFFVAAITKAVVANRAPFSFDTMSSNKPKKQDDGRIESIRPDFR
jgi:hypothetical protein